MPKFGHFLRMLTTRGLPAEGKVWLATETSHGHGVPVGKFIQVPMVVNTWNDIESVLIQLSDLNQPKPTRTREYLLGFLIGIIMGDAAKSKSREGASHRHIALVLSKKYATNLLIGEFACVSAKSIGLRMHRVNDLAKPPHKPFGFYEWVSQASPLVDWIYNIALGLKDGQLTTYDPVHADWMLQSPRDFRIGVINGIAESDGSVAIASQEVEFWVDPHRDLLKKMLELEGLRAFNNRQALSLSKTHAIKSFEVPIFNPELRTVRYQRHEVMAKARTLRRDERLPEELKLEIIALATQNLSVPDIVERIAETRKILISFEAAQRWASKASRDGTTSERPQ